MLIIITGPACSGKSSLARELRQRFGMSVWSGRDYVRLATQEHDARKKFLEMMNQAAQTPAASPGSLIFLNTECSQWSFETLTGSHICVIRMTAKPALLETRFSERLNAPLPDAIRSMLHRQSAASQNCPADLVIDTSEGDPESALQYVLDHLDIREGE